MNFVIFFVHLHKSIEKIESILSQPLILNRIYIMTETAELIDNEFLRQYELKVEDQMAVIEYSLQERKIFLTKLIIPESIRTKEFETEFVDMVFSNIKERNISVVPTSPEIAKFVRGNRKYKRMLPVGIRI